MSQRVSQLMDDIQRCLQQSGHWQTIPPTVEKMQSQAPFSIDTLTFLEWLQWVYLARLRAIIDAGSDLPSGALVAPYAEEALKADGVLIDNLLPLIHQLDSALA